MAKEKYLFCILFKNEKGLLGKVATLLGENDVNIETIKISSIDNTETMQKVEIYTSGINSERVFNDVIKPLPGVLAIFKFTDKEKALKQEICLIKVNNTDRNIMTVAKKIKDLDGEVMYMNNAMSVYKLVNDFDKVENLVNELNAISGDLEIFRSMVVEKSN